MNRPPYRSCLPLLLLAMPLAAAAIGVGELRGLPVMGERLHLEIDILNSGQRPPEASCFRLQRPGGDDLPWLQQATLGVRSGTVPVLEIRSTKALRDPVLQLGVYVGCGYEISRQYTVLAQAAGGMATLPPVAPRAEAVPPSSSPVRERSVRRSAPVAGGEPAAPVAPHRPPPSPPPRPPDRLTLSGGEVGDPHLVLAADLSSPGGAPGASDAQRQMLRLEFRTLMALNEQATTQLATAEKLRNMEALLGELQARAGEFAARVEQGAPPAASMPATTPPAALPATVPAPPVGSAPPLSEWSFYGLLLGLLFGLGGWFGWRSYRQRQAELPVQGLSPLPAGSAAGPVSTPAPAPGPVPVVHAPMDLHVESGVVRGPAAVDFELDGGDAAPVVVTEAVPVLHAEASLEATTVDEQFEVNPVMELADIMLSFGRVKGAAQALQEYIDSNPDEALQPWIRLMDVYRLAGMRGEFEQVARNLNRHFNVEIQYWDAAALDGGVESPVLPSAHAESLEDMPRLMSMICELWPDDDVVRYLHQLLRDNRGGKRIGFALPIVEEILFLIELKETSNRIDKKEDMP